MAKKSKEPKADWTPVRRGLIYCSPSCGGKCTFADYADCVQRGKRMRASMRVPQDWEVRVSENLGWFVSLEHVASNGLLTVSESGRKATGRYFAMLSLENPHCGDMRWTDTEEESSSPQEAVDCTLGRAREIIKKEVRQFTRVAGDAILWA